jgi:hypothetical protein
MFEIIIVVLVILWLFGYIGPIVIPAFPQGGDIIHVILVIAIILIVVSLVSGRRL